MMKPTGNLYDAAIIFSALRGDQVIALLSRLSVKDTQRLLAMAATLNPSAVDFETTGSRLSQWLSSATEKLTNVAVPKTDNTSLGFLVGLSAEQVERLLATVNTACWAPAMHAESTAIRNVVYQNVAPAVAEILKQEIALFAGTQADVQQSRQTIRAAAAKRGILAPHRGLQDAG